MTWKKISEEKKKQYTSIHNRLNIEEKIWIKNKKKTQHKSTWINIKTYNLSNKDKITQ
jgi:hypothetical protein